MPTNNKSDNFQIPSIEEVFKSMDKLFDIIDILDENYDKLCLYFLCYWCSLGTRMHSLKPFSVCNYVAQEHCVQGTPRFTTLSF